MHLVTGATGLLGTRLVFDLISRGEQVRACKRNKSDLEIFKKVFKYYGDQNLELFNQIHWVNCDLRDVVQIEEALDGVKNIFNCAAIVSFHHSDYEQMYETNVRGTHNLVNAALAKGLKTFCHVSSTAAVSKTKEEFQKESNPWKNDTENSYYSVTKQAAEQEVWRGVEEGLDAVIINPCIIVGPGDWNRSSVGIFKTIKKGLKFYTTGANAYVDVRDVSRAFINLYDQQIFNERFLCIGENLSFKAFFTQIANAFNQKAPFIQAKPWQANLIWRLEELKYRLTGKKPVITKDTAKSADTVVKFSNQKIKDAIAFEFTPIKEAVNYTADFIKGNADCMGKHIN